MKKIIIVASIIFITFFLSACNQNPSKVVGEYDTSKLSMDFGNKKAYEIGANASGMPIFKDTEKALKQAQIDFKEGFNAISHEYDLKPISKENFKDYMIYGGQLENTVDETARKQGIIISKFFDIYENSYNDDGE